MTSPHTPSDSPDVSTGESARPTVSPAVRRRNRLILIGLLLVCLAPVVASYLTFYVFTPDSRTNYGRLVDPQRDVNPLEVTVARLGALEPEELPVQAATGESVTLSAFAGRWLLVVPESGACGEGCRQRLVDTRQVRLTTGRERSRVGRVLLLSAQAPEPGEWLAEHPGLHVLRLPGRIPDALFPASEGHSASDHVFVVDPLGHLMMRWPVAADPNKTKKDLMRLLKVSRVG